jgi:TorA maturation chaperone TorD
MSGLLQARGVASVAEEARERIYGLLAALLSHPDEGRWGRALDPHAQRRLIADADGLRAMARGLDYPLGEEELPADQLDLRCLILEVCQPLKHLKADYERVLCGRRRAACSPFELDHREVTSEYLLIEGLAGIASWYQAFGFLEGDRLPPRPDHVACELEFMHCLLVQRRLTIRLASIDSSAASYAARCDLAQRTFFDDHLAGWLCSFSASLQACLSGGYLAPVGRFLAALVPLERCSLGVSGHSNLRGGAVPLSC